MAASTTLSSSITTFKPSPYHPRAASFNPLPALKLPSISPFTSYFIRQNSTVSPLRSSSAASTAETTTKNTTFHGLCYVVVQKLGSYALCGLPSSYQTRFIEPGEFTSKFSIIIGGDNFGCGSSREHAPVALGAAGVAAVVAESYARIFFRNSVSTGEVYPLETEVRICEECKTGDVVTVELGESRLINHTTGKDYKLKPIGDAGPVIEAGGIFAYARKTGMISTREA
ncbi:unnamed protein product [Withania somnifera]